MELVLTFIKYTRFIFDKFEKIFLEMVSTKLLSSHASSILSGRLPRDIDVS